jgi:hypothetical protein
MFAQFEVAQTSLHDEPLCNGQIRLMQINGTRLFRTGIATLSAILLLTSGWLLAIEFLRPPMLFRLEDAKNAQTLARYQTTSGIAAWLGLIRGRLWTEHALTFAPFSANEGEKAQPDQSAVRFESARKAAMRAVHFAPFDARAWLVIAQIDSALRDRDPALALKMSYYVGLNEEPMFPLRIAIATQSNAILDPEVRDLLGDEIQRVLATRPGSEPDIVAAYRGAAPEGKRFIEQEVGRSDQDLLSVLRARQDRLTVPGH